MRLARSFIVSLAVLGVSTASFAGDLQGSIAKAAQQQQPSQRSKIDSQYLWPGTGLVVAGMSMAVYGFLHTSGGDFVSGQVSKESKTGLGAAGLGIAAVGGGILYFGSQRASRAPSITVGPGRLTVAKRVSW